ncbi:MAG: tRNA dimethylallyltransferase [Chloroflexota bacterium]|nr:tRNA dimethylallyltransferase [Chloroflexota bacterium]
MGKTAVAVSLARATGGEIISFDSRQVFRGVEVCSNAPTPAELQGVKAHLVSVLAPSSEITAAGYVELARSAASAVSAAERQILTAGTGMYLKAYLDNLDLGGMGAVPGLRQQLEAEAATDLPGLARRLQDLSPGLAATTDLRNPVRVVRRMELLWAAALAQDDRDTNAGRDRPRTDAIKIGLRAPAAVLERWIAERIDRMLEAGWRDEVEALLAQQPGPSPQVLRSIGVAEMAAHLRGEVDRRTMVQRVHVRTRQYAKRQRTWFRADPEVTWIDAGNKATSDIVETILEMLN